MDSYYDNISSGYNRLYGEEQERKYIILKGLLKTAGLDILLDVGCGTGLARRHFKCNYIGIDPALKLLGQSEAKGLICATAECIPLKDRSCDVVISVTSMHNFGDIEAGFREMLRVGKSRFGFAILSKSREKDRIIKLIEKGLFDLTRVDCGPDIVISAGRR
ncbi:MAG: class I SAM-dependent methyltransferase [archaeon]